MAAMVDGSGGAAQAGGGTRPARTTTSAKSTMRATRPIASPYSCSSDCCAGWASWPLWTGGCGGTLPGTNVSWPGRFASRLPHPAPLLPATFGVLVVDVDLLPAELLGHPLLAGHGVLVEPDPLLGHDPLLDHRPLLTQDHLMLGLRKLGAGGGGVAVGVGDRLPLHPHPLPLDRNRLLDLLGGHVLSQPPPAPPPLGGADPQLLLRAGHRVIGCRARGVPAHRVPAAGAPAGGAVVVEAVVAPQLALLGLRQVLVGVASGGVFDQLGVVGDVDIVAGRGGLRQGDEAGLGAEQ